MIWHVDLTLHYMMTWPLHCKIRDQSRSTQIIPQHTWWTSWTLIAQLHCYTVGIVKWKQARKKGAGRAREKKGKREERGRWEKKGKSRKKERGGWQKDIEKWKESILSLYHDCHYDSLDLYTIGYTGQNACMAAKGHLTFVLMPRSSWRSSTCGRPYSLDNSSGRSCGTAIWPKCCG